MPADIQPAWNKIKWEKQNDQNLHKEKIAPIVKAAHSQDAVGQAIRDAEPNNIVYFFRNMLKCYFAFQESKRFNWACTRVV